MAFRFDQDQRNIVAEKATELANLAIVSLVISQILFMQFDFRATGLGFLVFLVG